jgi:hypothetical protein
LEQQASTSEILGLSLTPQTCNQCLTLSAENAARLIVTDAIIHQLDGTFFAMQPITA